MDPTAPSPRGNPSGRGTPAPAASTTGGFSAGNAATARNARPKRRFPAIVFAIEVVAIVAVIGTVAYIELSPSAGWAVATGRAPAWPEAVAERTVAPPPVKRITVLAVGDLMTHSPQFPAARTATGYDFMHCFAPVAAQIASADLAMGNFETVLGGESLGYSGFPRFNAPDSYAEALVKTGFDVLTTANNHCLDQGVDALERTLGTLDRLGVAHTGTARTKGEANTILVKDVEGVTVAIIAYTYSMNGFTPPDDKPWMVNQLDKAAIIADIDEAESLGVDLVVVSMHNGIEYARQPSDSQERLERAFVDAGADVVFGSHPHVIQPMETYEVKRSDGTTETAFIIHSLGNFISNQRDRYSDAGVMVRLTFEKDLVRHTTQLTQAEYVPTWVDVTGDAGKKYRVLPVGVNGQADLPEVSADDRSKMSRTWSDTTSHLGGIGPSPLDPAGILFFRAEGG